MQGYAYILTHPGTVSILKVTQDFAGGLFKKSYWKLNLYVNNTSNTLYMRTYLMLISHNWKGTYTILQDAHRVYCLIDCSL